MKKINLVLFCLILFATNSFGQTAFNPFTQNIHFEPEPTALGFPCGSIQKVAFTQGLLTAADADLWQTEPLKVKVFIAGFQFNGSSASSVVSGGYSTNFNWAFDPLNSNCIIGTQNQTLMGTGSNPVFPNPLASGDIKLSLKVPSFSPFGDSLKVDVILIVPSYMQLTNIATDDDESTQTQSYCPSVSITGTVFRDDDTIGSPTYYKINGIGIDTVSGDSLCATLLNEDTIVLATAKVDANGNFIFLNVPPNTSYIVSVANFKDTVGQKGHLPSDSLPVPWVNTGEDCCDTAGFDTFPDGITYVAVIDSPLTNVNFGFKRLPPTGPVPTILEGFFVTEYNCDALLSWTTSQEINSSHTEIFRKEPNQASFKKIASVLSAGNSAVQKMYSYLDKDATENTLYEYRLRFVDIDGQSTKSDIKTINLKCSDNNISVHVFPNPATSKLNLLYVTEEDNVELNIEILDVAGRTIVAKSQIMQNGGSMITFDINSFSTGTYFLRYKDAEGLSFGSIKFIKH